jgi:hypothetical protein
VDHHGMQRTLPRHSRDDTRGARRESRSLEMEKSYEKSLAVIVFLATARQIYGSMHLQS